MRMTSYFDVIVQLIPSCPELRKLLDSIHNDIGIPTALQQAAHASYAEMLDETSLSGWSTAHDTVEAGKIRILETLLYDMLEDFVWEQLNSSHWKDVALYWRKYYAFIILIKVILLSTQIKTKVPKLIELCDTGLLIGDSKVGKTLATIAAVLQKLGSINNSPVLENVDADCVLMQTNLVTLPGRKLDIPQLDKPSLEYFYQNHFQPEFPVLVTKAIEHWPASSVWSTKYIQDTCGSRTVPVEIGSKYTAEDWTQKLMTIDDFVTIFMRPSTLRDSRPVQMGYIAQHTLFDQIPELREDIRVPEYCSLGRSEDIEINAWFGPASTLTPTHFDPNHNLLAQVFGYKFIRLFPPLESVHLSPHDKDSLLFNTSQLDMEDPLVLTKHPELAKASYADIKLSPGDMLYIPPGWWHFVRSLSPSFSVSFWFQ